MPIACGSSNVKSSGLRLESRGIGFATWGDADLESALEEVRTFRRYARPARA